VCDRDAAVLEELAKRSVLPAYVADGLCHEACVTELRVQSPGLRVDLDEDRLGPLLTRCGTRFRCESSLVGLTFDLVEILDVVAEELRCARRFLLGVAELPGHVRPEGGRRKIGRAASLLFYSWVVRPLSI